MILSQAPGGPAGSSRCGKSSQWGSRLLPRTALVPGRKNINFAVHTTPVHHTTPPSAPKTPPQPFSPRSILPCRARPAPPASSPPRPLLSPAHRARRPAAVPALIVPCWNGKCPAPLPPGCLRLLPTVSVPSSLAVHTAHTAVPRLCEREAWRTRAPEQESPVSAHPHSSQPNPSDHCGAVSEERPANRCRERVVSPFFSFRSRPHDLTTCCVPPRRTLGAPSLEQFPYSPVVHRHRPHDGFSRRRCRLGGKGEPCHG